jgi:hypothetical protein
MTERIILDLCSGSGAWSQPYVEAGYDVRRYDIRSGDDVRLLTFPRAVTIHGILAAPPCTYFCRMRMCRGRPSDAQFLEGLSVVDACLRAVLLCEPAWWALENPQGYLSDWLGPPILKFHPADYGDPWTKNTWLWGKFAKPIPVALRPLSDPLIHRKKGRRGVAQSDAENAVTPPGFARAFFEANP